jgi:hypothetical protein
VRKLAFAFQSGGKPPHSKSVYRLKPVPHCVRLTPTRGYTLPSLSFNTSTFFFATLQLRNSVTFLFKLKKWSRRRDYSLTPLRKTVRADFPHTAPQGNLLIHQLISHRVRSVDFFAPVQSPEEVSLTLWSPCQSLRSTGITLLHHYYELVRLPRALLEFLASSARYSIPPCGDILALPSSSQIIGYMSPSLTPVVLHNLAFQSAASLLPSSSFNTVGFPQRVNFGAQSVHP